MTNLIFITNVIFSCWDTAFVFVQYSYVFFYIYTFYIYISHIVRIKASIKLELVFSITISL